MHLSSVSQKQQREKESSFPFRIERKKNILNDTGVTRLKKIKHEAKQSLPMDSELRRLIVLHQLSLKTVVLPISMTHPPNTVSVHGRNKLCVCCVYICTISLTRCFQHNTISNIKSPFFVPGIVAGPS